MADTALLVDEEERAETRHPARIGRRIRLAQALALMALVAAVVGAIGPADHLSTRYSWPPSPLPAGTPSQAWYTPLLLIRHRPDAISARVPCALPPALPNAARPVTVLATARLPKASDGLAVTRTGDALVIGIGDQILTSVGLSSSGAGEEQCAYTLQLAGSNWSIDGGPNEIAEEGSLDRMPRVTGIFSALDLASEPAPSIDVTTAVHAARTTARQTIAWTLAVLAGIAALALVAVERRPGLSGAAAARLLRRAARQARPADGVVAAVLLGWWVLSPAFFDDGWIIAQQSAFSNAREFSTYYNVLATNLPLGYWLGWAQHWLTQSSAAFLVLRIPALLCLAATWILCRWILNRILGRSRDERTILWALAGGFLVGATAWGMTLRSEPVTALLVTGVFACAVRFVERETTAPIVGAAVLLPLAITGHPGGIVSIAPVLVTAPKLVRWAHRRLPVAATIVAVALALLAVLAFVGSDAELRHGYAEAQREFASAPVTWRDEVLRYANLSLPFYGTPLRRASVALMTLVVLAFMLQRRRAGRTSLDFPAASLAVGLLLLIATPSKWPWHFGALLGVAAVAVAAETARVRSEALRSAAWRLWPFVALGATIVAAAWSWSVRQDWTLLDLRTLEWALGLEQSLPFSKFAIALPFLLFMGATLRAVFRHRGEPLSAISWRTASWAAPVLAAPLIAFTVAVLAADTAKTSSWTLARQNIESLVGGSGCGLADEALVPDPGSMRALEAVGTSRVGSTPAWVPSAPVSDLRRFALEPAGEKAAASPWFRLPRGRVMGVFVAGSPDASDRLALEWGRLSRGRVDALASDTVYTSSAADRSGLPSWRFYAAAELPPQAPGTTAVRMSLRGVAGPGTGVAVTAPVTYANEPLTKRLDTSRTLVNPGLLAYLRCVRQPVLSGGIVKVPHHLVSTDARYDHVWSVSGRTTNPFVGLLDLYQIEQFSLADSSDPPESVMVFDVKQQISGAKLAPPTTLTLTS